ncbi:MAG TPA: YneF family protein, partial [Bacilli bacterium]
MVELAWWWFVLIILGVLIVGAVIGFFIARKVFANYLEKNPPV